MGIIAENLKGLELSSGKVDGFKAFCELMAGASATGHLFYRHGFDNAADISVDLRGLGNISAPRFVTVNVGNQLALEFNDPSDTNVFFNELSAAGVHQPGGARLSVPYVVINPEEIDLEVASRALKKTLNQSAALEKVTPQYEDISAYIRDLVTHEHAFSDEYTIDQTFDRITAAITEENFETVMDIFKAHSPTADDPDELAFDLMLICSALIEERGLCFAAIGTVLEAALPEITGEQDINETKELLETLHEMQAAVV